MVHKITKISFGIAAVTFLLMASIPGKIAGKPSFGILPVSIRSVSSSVLNEQQALSLTVQLQEYLSSRLGDLGTVGKLSREHILLLLKEVPAPDPENLAAESYKVISKKENLTYFLKCAVESVQMQNELIQIPVSMNLIEGNSGKIIWGKKVTGSRVRGSSLISEHLLLNEIIKPALEQAIVEIKAMNL